MSEILEYPDVKEDREITLKEMVARLAVWVNYLKSKWLIIVLCGVLGGGLGIWYAFTKKPLYTATLTFVVEDDKSSGGGLSSALGLASTFGFDIGGGSSGGVFSSSNLTELMKSRSLVEKALLNPITVNNKQESIASYYIEFTKLYKEWADKPELKNIKFEPFADRSKFTRQQDSVLGRIYESIAGHGGILSVSQKDKKVSILSIEVECTDELFSKVFVECIANVASGFYIETKTKKSKYNYDILQKQTDSIRNELDAAINGVAIANDATYNLNPALNIKRTPSARRQVDVQANTAILTQLVANLEMAKVSLRKETPLIQIIDKPILPLLKSKPGKLRSLILGGILGGMLAIIILLLRRLWKTLV